MTVKVTNCCVNNHAYEPVKYYSLEVCSRKFNLSEKVVILHNKWGFPFIVRGVIANICNTYLDLLVDDEFVNRIQFENIKEIHNAS